MSLKQYKGCTPLFCFFVGVSLANPPANFSGWDLIFEDNFDGESLDLSKWNPTYNWGSTHNHNAYCAPENVTVKEGKLIIKGEKKRHPKAPATAESGGKSYPLDYTSGAIDTRGHFEVKYGYIEGRFKAPKQLGTWPAFWTLQDGWPPEIDILEIPHARNQHHYYLHYTDNSWFNEHGAGWDHEKSFGGVHEGPDKSADFHTYGVEWDENNLNFYFDDKKFASYNRPTEIKQLNAQYIIINLAIGGWAGDNIEVSEYNPAYFECDFVRVWKSKPAKADTVKIMSMNFGTCMANNEGKLVLGDCKSENATAIITPLSAGIYRIDLGGVTVEIPNEKTDAGIDAGLYSYNGGNHQKVNFERQSGYEGDVFRLKMQHSNHYLRATSDGTRIVQDWNDSWPWNQMWRLLKPEELDTTTSNIPQKIGFSKSKIHNQGENYLINFSQKFYPSNSVEISLVDLQGHILKKFNHDVSQKNDATFSVKNFAPGIYLLILKSDNYKESLKFRL